MKNCLILIAILFFLQGCCRSSEKHEGENSLNTIESIDTTQFFSMVTNVADTCRMCEYCFTNFDKNVVLCLISGQCNADVTFKIFSLEKDVPECIFETWAGNSYFMKYGNKIYRWSSHMNVDWYTMIEKKDSTAIETVLCRTELRSDKGLVVTHGSPENILKTDPQNDELPWKKLK